MNSHPTAISMMGVIGLILVPACIILASNWLAYMARRYAAARWEADAEARRREEQTAHTWVALHDRQNIRLDELERRIDSLESGKEDSNQSLSMVYSLASKAERSLRRRNMWDSSRAE